MNFNRTIVNRTIGVQECWSIELPQRRITPSLHHSIS
jgi:hypothetical protein